MPLNPERRKADKTVRGRNRDGVSLAFVSTPMLSDDVLRTLIKGGLARLIARRLVLSGINPQQLRSKRQRKSPVTKKGF